MLVVAIRREDPGEDARTDYVLAPDAETTLRAGDVLLSKGTRSGADRLREWAETDG
jgi:uncharacterized protein with PhoU and TrkA domain